jgi:predicted nucleic acid-binding protein
MLFASSRHSNFVRDKKVFVIFASIALARPDYFVTGDSDLLKDNEIIQTMKVCSSREFSLFVE